MKKRAAQFERPALDLIEDAVHLLRTAPPTVLLTYYTGAIPFVLGLLFFWSDMSCSAFAERRCPAAALGMALLFLWLKCWQAVFACALRARLAAAPPPQWTLRRLLRLLVVQGIVQPWRIFLLPVALIFAIPFAWVLAFFENVTVLGDGVDAGVRAAGRRAAAQARVWPKQNHLLLAILALVALVLWLNSLIAVLTIPQLLKMFLGVETAFSRAGIWVIFNTTFLAVTVALAWLALDPLLTAIYALRCFHGEARQDGADLLAELSRVRARHPLAAVAVALMLSLLPLAGFAAEPARPPPAAAPAAGAVPPGQIDDAVKRTLQNEKYAWRLPREKVASDDSPAKAWLRAFFKSIGDTVMGWLRAIRNVIRDILDWFNKHFTPKPKPGQDAAPSDLHWTVLLRWLAYALLAFAAAALGLLVFRLWRQGWHRRQVVAAQVVAARPDLNDENVTAAQLPEDQWLKLAAELLAQGDTRLALRAFYLASLAHLAAREIVSIARFKSNHDYENEVNRRARGIPELRAAFAANVLSFDRAWYGLYDVTADVLAQFRANFERIRSC